MEFAPNSQSEVGELSAQSTLHPAIATSPSGSLLAVKFTFHVQRRARPNAMTCMVVDDLNTVKLFCDLTSLLYLVFNEIE